VKERVLTAVVLLAIVVGALFLDPTGWAVKVLVVAVAGVCGYEFGVITKLPYPQVAPLVFVLFGVLSKSHSNPLTYSMLALIGVLLIPAATMKNWVWLNGFAGSLWVFGSVMALFLLASTKSPSTWPLLLTAAIPIWCGDTAAIFVGKAFGKHKLAPAISPNKTWEGAIGNLLACVGAALALGAIFHYPMLLMVLLGLNCGVLGQAGDLFESWLKRKADVKDSGNILPGHGGLLDRLDSLMATAPFSLLILQSLVVLPGVPK
jgi:phosphatidate cytidylyltransferase